MFRRKSKLARETEAIVKAIEESGVQAHLHPQTTKVEDWERELDYLEENVGHLKAWAERINAESEYESDLPISAFNISTALAEQLELFYNAHSIESYDARVHIPIEEHRFANLGIDMTSVVPMMQRYAEFRAESIARAGGDGLDLAAQLGIELLVVGVLLGRECGV